MMDRLNEKMTSILIVEDDPMQAETLRLGLVYCGYRVAATISHGEEALERVQSLAPDLVLMDILLAGKMDGIEAAQKIHESCDIPVLFLTAYADDEFFRRARVTEPYAFMLKPCSTREIQLAIETALYRHNTERTARTALEQAVTERTAELVQARDRNSSILESISDAFVSLDTSWHYTYVNAKAGELFGRKPEALIGKHIWSEFPEGVGQPFYHAYHKAMAEQTPIEMEEYYPPWQRWFENRIQPSREGLAIFFHDITERKRSEQALRESERYNRMLFESLPTGLALCRMDGTLVDINQAFASMLGRSIEETLPLSYWDITPAKYAEQEQVQLATLSATGRYGPYEKEFIHKDGHLVPVVLSGRIIEKDGERYIWSSVKDISERKQSGAQIQHQLEMLQALYSGAHKLSESLDFSGIAQSVTQLCVEVLGVQLAWLGRAEADGSVSLLSQYPAANPYPRSISVRWDESPLGQGSTGRAIREGAPVFSTEISKDKKFSPWLDMALQEGFHSSAAFPLISRGKAFGTLNLYSTVAGFFTPERVELFQALAHQAAAALVNITLYDEVRAYAWELEQRVADRTADLVAINQELEAYSYSVSHDLRAPLRAMQGFAQALEEDYGAKLGSAGQDYIQRIIASAQRMDTLIQDLLAYSQLTRADIQLKPASLDLAVKEALAQLRSEIKQSAAKITLAPPLAAVMGQARILTQIVSNLLGNAIKFVASATRPEVKVWTEERGERVRLWVEDNGIGIDPEHQARIFRVFERLHGVETYPGTGIGLAIVNKGANRMGGEAGVESIVGKGSRFWVELDKPPGTEKK
jgi:PAS domain S-box-containing protein